MEGAMVTNSLGPIRLRQAPNGFQHLGTTVAVNAINTARLQGAVRKVRLELMELRIGQQQESP